MMQLSVFTVSTPELTPEELARAAREAGLHAVEWRYKETDPETFAQPPSYWGNNRCTIAPSGGLALAERFRRAAADNGLVSLSVTPYLQVGDLNGLEQVLETAAAVGASFIRLGVCPYDRSRPYGELYELQRRYLAEAEKRCAARGVKGLIETHHGTIAASASGAYRLCEGFDPAAIGVLYDPGNMVHEGFENYRMGMELLGPYLAHVHVKNAGWRQAGTTADGAADWRADWLGLTHGAVPWRQVLEDLAAVGYKGALGVEDFSGEFADSTAMLKHFATYIGGLLDAVQQQKTRA